jgi:hypothetical protein
LSNIFVENVPKNKVFRPKKQRKFQFDVSIGIKNLIFMNCPLSYLPPLLGNKFRIISGSIFKILEIISWA